MHARTIALAAAVAAAGALAPATGLGAPAPHCPIAAAGAPTLGPGADPAGFVARVTNPFFPLRPGTVLRYRGTSDGARAYEVVRVMPTKRRILGIPVTTVRDRVWIDGHLAETTRDFYAQDRAGAVWYLGEATAEIEDGRVTSREGSWRAGVEGARGGVFMPAAPRAGEEFQQELKAGEAEDRFRVASLRGRVLRTLECTPLEPRVLDLKLYVRGVGPVAERQLRGPGTGERLDLVAFTRPRG